ncbi:MAG: hypothetical protein M1812_006903 [Candelaria pacifica]|nr:MAG: hypothetical protein M1812_006903 [Candelaria pacifica]
MAGNQSRSRAKPASATVRRTRGPSRKVEQDVVPDIFQDMLAEAVSSSPAQFGDEIRSVKRRKLGPNAEVNVKQESPSGEVSVRHASHEPSSPSASTDVSDHEGKSHIALQQTAFDESGDSEESEMEWEEVDISGHDRIASDLEDGREERSLNIVLQGNESFDKKTIRSKRKPITPEERKSRIEIHKAHLLCLTAHVDFRNQMCNDVETQAVLKPLVPKRMRSYLNPNQDLSQFQKTRSFMDGLSQAKDLWKVKFNVTASGMRKANWAESEAALRDFKLPEDIDPPIDQNEFRNLARKLEGSRDVGTQLFCSLLRSVGVTARLVCSLQALPFAAAARAAAHMKSTTDYVIAESDAQDTTSEGEGVEWRARQPLAAPRRARRIGQPGFGGSSKVDLGKPPPPKTPPRKRIKDSPYPVYWVEAFNTALQKWIPVDALVTDSVSKPSRLEPPASDAGNNMSYVLAFEEDGSARDVTRRYASSYNAKTRRNRVEATKHGERWWKKTMRALRRGWDMDRDQVEDAELAAKEAGEKMPRNVQDFKDHPYYVLERHLRRNEVIHPRREVGKVSASKSLTNNDGKSLESIFRRRDVNVVKSGDGWYRLGRDIKSGEQPIKFVRSRSKRGCSLEGDDQAHSDDGEQADTGMYAEFQTILYIPPPVVRGKVPKNGFGNLDIYAPNMVPLGGTHIPHPEAARAARITGVDYADAVTGFEFRGRHGTAVIKGVVVAEEYREAIATILERFEDDRAEAEEKRRSLEALRMWKRFMAGVRIRERIAGYEIEGEQEASDKGINDAEGTVDDDEDDQGGGFFPDRDQQDTAEPTIDRFPDQSCAQQPFNGGGSFIGRPDLVGSVVHAFDATHKHSDTPVKAQPAPQECNSSRANPRTSSDKRLPTSITSDLEYGDSGGFILEDEDDTPHRVAATEEDVGVVETARAVSDTNTAQNHNVSDEATDPAALSQATGINSSSTTMLPDKGLGERDGTQAQALAVDVSVHEDPTSMLSDDESTDRGSLLSQDPDDEDADPEWLAEHIVHKSDYFYLQSIFNFAVNYIANTYLLRSSYDHIPPTKMPSACVQPIERQFKSKPSTARNDPKLRKALMAKNLKFKPTQDMDTFVWTPEHTMLLKRLVVQYYTKGKPCTVIYAKFNELASSDYSSAFLLKKIKGITEGNGGKLARILCGKGGRVVKKKSGLIMGQRGAGIKD